MFLFANFQAISSSLLSFTFWSIIDAGNRKRQRKAHALAHVTQDGVGCISVGGVEETSSHQLKIILLCNSSMIIHSIVCNSFITDNLLFIHHINLSSSLPVNQS